MNISDNSQEQQKNTNPALKSILTLSVFILIIGGAFLLNLIMPKADVLQSERRKPAAFPKLSADTILSSAFMDGFGKYATDNFIFRDAMRTIRALSVFDIFMQTDKSGLYIDDTVGAGKFEKADEKSVRKTAKKIRRICELFPPELDIYYAIVPDKSIYVKRYLPGFDTDKAYEILTEELGGIKIIDLRDALSGGDFYKTDIHWDQSKISKVPEALGKAMGFADRLDLNFTANTAGIFDGVYTGQIALPLKQDNMTYMTSDILNNAIVSYLSAKTGQWEEGLMYNAAAVNGRDPYDLFLGGVQPLITIENPSAKTDRQLYLFRDSFGSSLAPLLTPAYAKITIIDVRYIDIRVLENYITFAQSDADVLFLYSSQILNNPAILLVN